jgi:hypothetical protein
MSSISGLTVASSANPLDGIAANNRPGRGVGDALKLRAFQIFEGGLAGCAWAGTTRR